MLMCTERSFYLVGHVLAGASPYLPSWQHDAMLLMLLAEECDIGYLPAVVCSWLQKFSVHRPQRPACGALRTCTCRWKGLNTRKLDLGRGLD